MTRTLLEVIDGVPPIYDAIVQVLPEAANDGVIFAYAGKVYGRGLKKLSRELDAHERVHIERQQKFEGGADTWWRLFLTNTAFRFNEEFIAHRAEYETYCKRHINPVKRAQYLRLVAKRLASPLYGLGGTVEQLALAIKHDANPCEPT